MKHKKKIIPIVFIIAVFWLTACQATPTKKMDYYSNTIEKADSGEQSNVNVPANVNLDIEDKDKKIHIIFDDTNVFYPENATISKNQISPAFFSQSDFDQILPVFFGEKKYQIDDGLLVAKQQIDLYEAGKFDDPMCPLPEYYEELKETVAKGGQGNLEQRMEDMKVNDPAQYQMELEAVSNPSGDGFLINEKWTEIDTKSGFPYVMAINVNPKTVEVDLVTERSTSMFDETAEIDSKDILNVSEEEAVTIAESFIKSIGLDEYHYSGVIFKCNKFEMVTTNDNEAVQYRIQLVPSIGNLDINYHWFGTSGNTLPSEFENVVSEEGLQNQEYAPTWIHNGVSVFVDNEGVRSAFLFSPFKIERSENIKNDELLSFEQVVNNGIEAMMVRRSQAYNEHGDVLLPNEDSINKKVHVKQIKFGLCRIPVKDNLNEYELVPAWDFIGISEIYNTENKAFESQFNIYTGDRVCLITVNALDGSIIDRRFGN